MVTIDDTSFKSSIALSSIMSVKTKVNMLKIINKLDLYVSPNLKKDETARRVAEALLEEPVAIISSLCKAELELLDEFIQAGPNAYITRKARKMEYKLQKYGLVLTYIDEKKGEWQMLMPDSVRIALAPDLPLYLDMARQGKKGPTPKELRMMEAFGQFFGINGKDVDEDEGEDKDEDGRKKGR